MQVARLKIRPSSHQHKTDACAGVTFGNILLTKVVMVSAITTAPFKPQENGGRDMETWAAVSMTFYTTSNFSPGGQRFTADYVGGKIGVGTKAVSK
jgi:hypothetical protein